MENWEIEGTKHFKALFVDFIAREMTPYLESHGFKKSKIATYKRKVGAQVQEFVIDGATRSYLGYDLNFGINFPKFNKFRKEFFDYVITPNTTQHEISYMNGLPLLKESKIDSFFDLSGVNDFPRASEMIKQTFELIVLPHFDRLDGLLKVREFFSSLNLDTADGHYDYATIPSADVAHSILTITRIFEPERVEELTRKLKLYGGLTDYFFSDSYLKLQLINSEEVSELLASEK